jgi:hypothetical protein
MTQQVTVTSESGVDMRPLVESAIERQLAIIAVGIRRTQNRIAELEAGLGITVTEFQRRLSTGDVEESLELLELEGELRTLDLLEAQEAALRNARVS